MVWNVFLMITKHQNTHLDSFQQKWSILLDDLKTQRSTSNMIVSLSPNPRIQVIQMEIEKLEELEKKMNRKVEWLSFPQTQSDPDKLVKAIHEQIKSFCDTLSIVSETSSDDFYNRFCKWENGSIKIVFEGGYDSFENDKSAFLSSLIGLPKVLLRVDTLTKILCCQTDDKILVEYTQLTMDEFQRRHVSSNFEERVLFTKCQGLGTSMISLASNAEYFTKDQKVSNRISADAVILIGTSGTTLTGESIDTISELATTSNLFMVILNIDSSVFKGFFQALKTNFLEVGITEEDSDRFFNERIFFINTSPELLPTEISKLKIALRNDVFNVERIKASIEPIFNDMWTQYNFMIRKDYFPFPCPPSILEALKGNINNISELLYGCKAIKSIGKET